MALTEDEAAGLIVRQWATGDIPASAARSLDDLLGAVMALLPLYVVDTGKATKEQAARIRELSGEIVRDIRPEIYDLCGRALTWALLTFLAEHPDAPLRLEEGGMAN